MSTVTGLREIYSHNRTRASAYLALWVAGSLESLAPGTFSVRGDAEGTTGRGRRVLVSSAGDHQRVLVGSNNNNISKMGKGRTFREGLWRVTL